MGEEREREKKITDLIAEESFAVLSVSESDTVSGSFSSDTSITFLSFKTSSSEVLYSFSSAWTASATVGKGLPRCVIQNLSPGKRSYVLSGGLCKADASGSEATVTLFSCKSCNNHRGKKGHA